MEQVREKNEQGMSRQRFPELAGRWPALGKGTNVAALVHIAA